MKLRKLQVQDVQFTLSIDQDETSVRGSFESDDPAADRALEDEILARLRDGDMWAFAQVKVTAHWREWEGSDFLGGCSYKDEEDFRQDQYYADMKERAVDALNETLARAAADLNELEEA